MKGTRQPKQDTPCEYLLLLYHYWLLLLRDSIYRHIQVHFHELFQSPQVLFCLLDIYTGINSLYLYLTMSSTAEDRFLKVRKTQFAFCKQLPVRLYSISMDSTFSTVVTGSGMMFGITKNRL